MMLRKVAPAVLLLIGCKGAAADQRATSSARAQSSAPSLRAQSSAPVVVDADCKHPAVTAACAGGWCKIPAGCFVMGSPESEWGRGAKTEDPAAVTLTHAFEIGQHEVTRAQWVAAGLPDPSSKRDGSGDGDDPKSPVGNVTWYEAVAFANLLSERHSPALPACYELSNCSGALGKGMKCEGVKATTPSLYDCAGYRLPTFAEWEYVARAGTRTPVYAGEVGGQGEIGACFKEASLEASAWYCANSGGSTHPVGKKTPNAWGLFDMIGNAAEWLNDAPRGQALPGPLTDPGAELAASAKFRDFRGCSYNGSPASCRAASTLYGTPANRAPGVGFRLLRTLR